MTEFDFRTPERRDNLRYTTTTMLKLGVVPILNENDAVSGNEGYEAEGMFSDNDGLAALVAQQARRYDEGDREGGNVYLYRPLEAFFRSGLGRGNILVQYRLRWGVHTYPLLSACGSFSMLEGLSFLP